MAREFGALGAHPSLERGGQWGAPLPPSRQPLLDRKAIDLAFDPEKRVDAFDGLQRDRRDRRRIVAAPRIGCDVGQLKELPARMAPAQRLDDRARLAVGKIEAVVAAERVGLQNVQ